MHTGNRKHLISKSTAPSTGQESRPLNAHSSAGVVECRQRQSPANLTPPGEVPKTCPFSGQNLSHMYERACVYALHLILCEAAFLVLGSLLWKTFASNSPGSHPHAVSDKGILSRAV